MDHIVCLIDHHRRRQEFLQELDVGAFHIVAGALPVGHIAGAGRNRADIWNAERGRNKFIHLSFSFMYIDFFRAAYRMEDIAAFSRRLAFSKEKETAVFQRGMEYGEQSPLQDRLEVDHHVPAADQVQFSKGRI